MNIESIQKEIIVLQYNLKRFSFNSTKQDKDTICDTTKATLPILAFLSGFTVGDEAYRS